MSKQTEKVLKNCPFCNSEAHLYQGESDEQGERHFVECLGCEASSGIYFTEKEAITSWNARVRTGEADWVEIAKDGLPKENGIYLVTTKYNGRLPVYESEFIGGEFGYYDTYGSFNAVEADYLAWRPLPEPFQLTIDSIQEETKERVNSNQHGADCTCRFCEDGYLQPQG